MTSLNLTEIYVRKHELSKCEPRVFVHEKILGIQAINPSLEVNVYKRYK